MENKAKMMAIVFSTLGLIFMVSMAFQVLPFKYAIFAGVSCFFLAGMCRRFVARQK
ncbi:MAG TPA: hypothetical protein VID27_05850 [Blastocatellia bacterium]|jgi:hypothetical protein